MPGWSQGTTPNVAGADVPPPGAGLSTVTCAEPALARSLAGCTGFPTACLPLVGQGAACGGAALCGQGYYCDPASASCAALPDLGDGCVLSRDGTTAELPCVRGRCDRDGTKTCVSPKADGEPCTAGDECLSFFCDSAQQRCASGGFVPPVCTPP